MFLFPCLQVGKCLYKRLKCFKGFNEFVMYLFRWRKGFLTNACICIGTHSQPLLQHHLMDFDETLYGWRTQGPLHVLRHYCQICPGADPGHDHNRLQGALFSSPEPKARVSYCHSAPSVVRPSVRRPSGVNFHIFDFSSETAERNSTKLDRKQDLTALYQFCVFRANSKNKMAALASDWLRHFWLLLWNRWTEFNETWQEARSQRLLPSLCFSGRSEKQDGRPGLWLAETFSTSPLKPLNGIQQNLTGSKISKPSTKFVFFGSIGKTRWPPWPLIGRDIFDFSSETTERNSTKFDRKQDLNILYQVCVFRVDGKNKMATPAFDWLRHFRLLCRNRWTEFNESWQEARSQRPLPSLCFSGRSEKQDVPLASDWLRYFRLLLLNRWMEFNETWQELKSKCPLQGLCFSGRSEKQDGRLGSDWPRYFRLLLRNRWTEFNETW